MQQAIKDVITSVLTDLGFEPVEFVVEHPADPSHGDYATNVALVCSKQAGQVPRPFAERMAAALAGTVDHVASIDVAGPGFINFTLDRAFFAEQITHIRDAEKQWGKNDSWAGKTVLVEYTDPNPFKEFHIGHLFTNCVGESIARLFMMNGANTKRVNYQGDVGMHVACAIYGMQQLGITTDSEFSAADLGRAYALGATAYKADEAAAEPIRTINKQVYERSDDSITALYDSGREVSLAYFETIYEVLGTKFDAYFFESEAGPRGKEIVLNNPDAFPESEGARVFQGEAYGLHTRVFLNTEGLPTYEAKELALPQLKEERCGVYDHSVVSTANEITEYFKVLLKAMEFTAPELAAKTEHIGHGTVRLSTGKMSSRTGDVIPALTFIDEVADSAKEKMRAVANEDTTGENDALARAIAIAAIKYATLRSNILQDTVFDKERALSFEGDSGPYLQYTHARICSVLKKAAATGVAPDAGTPPPTPYAVERLLYQFPEVIEAALAERAPHQVTVFLTQLASEFNSFYAVEPIADPEDPHAPYKLALADAVRITLQNGLWTLGIKAPEAM